MAKVDGGLVRAARLRKGLTQQQVADLCRTRGAPLGKSDMSKAENNGGFSPRALPVVAEVLGLTVDELLASSNGNGSAA